MDRIILEGLPDDNAQICLTVTSESAQNLERTVPGTVEVSNFGATIGIDSKLLGEHSLDRSGILLFTVV